ncbi:SRPBCC family protein [Xanthobacteraceae bacterium A53D]
MALEMSGSYDLPVDRETAWAALNDPAILKRCIPGCEELEKVSDTELKAVVVSKVGPVKARFRGTVTLSDFDPPASYRISGEGDGGIAGFAKGGATVELTSSETGTTLVYKAEAQIGGKLAQLGQRLVAGTAKKIADEFFKNFAEAVAQETSGEA